MPPCVCCPSLSREKRPLNPDIVSPFIALTPQPALGPYYLLSTAVESPLLPIFETCFWTMSPLFFSARLCLLVSCRCFLWAYSARRRPLVLVLGTQCRCCYSVYILLLVRSLPCSSCWRPSVSSYLGAVVPSFRLAGAATFSLSPSACVSPQLGPSWWSLLYSVASSPPCCDFCKCRLSIFHPKLGNSSPSKWSFGLTYPSSPKMMYRNAGSYRKSSLMLRRGLPFLILAALMSRRCWASRRCWRAC
jgi:hypothetical protein